MSEEKKSHLKVKNDLLGFQEVLKRIKQLKFSKEVITVIEATGGYQYGVVYFLLEKGFVNVKVINPTIAKSFSRMNNIREAKTDKIDAKLLAELGKIKELPSYTESKDDIKKKQIVTTLDGLKKSLREQKQRRNHFKRQSEVIPCKEILESAAIVIKALEKEIDKLGKLLCSLTKEDNQIVSSISGISEKGAAVISTQLGDISRFRNSKQVTAFAGLDPRTKESGTSVKGKGKISKKGNELLRCALFQSAWYIYMQAVKGKGDKIFVDFVQRLREKKLHYYQILCAVAHKLLGIIFALLKKREKFQENYYFNLRSV